MPVVTDPKIAASTVRLKNAQTKLTTLRRRHLESGFIAKSVVEDFVLRLAADFRQAVLNLPRLIRLGLPTDFQKMNTLEIEDAIERVCDAWLLEFSRQEIKPPEPEKSKGYVYTTPPARENAQNRPPWKPPNDTHFRAAIR